MIARIITIAGLLALTLLSGCASFPQEEVAKVEKMPDMSNYQNKPSVYIDYHFYRGEPGSAKAVEVSRAKEQLMPEVKRVIEESKLFSSVTYDEFQKGKVDYVIRISHYNHGDVGSAAVMGFITGLTLGVIPSAATDNYTMNVEVLDRQGKSLTNNSSKDAVKTWLGIWFIPAMSNTPEKAIKGTLENQLRHALNELLKSNSLKYSLNDRVMIPYRNA